MAGLWIAAGAFLVIFTMADTFFTVLNYNERGLFVNRFIRGEWTLIRWGISRIPVRRRGPLLRQVTGIILVSAISVWLAGIILGFALIFYGGIEMGAITSSEGHAGFWDALYLSIGQFATVGVEHVSATNTGMAILTVVETMISIVFLSMMITFLVNIYNCIQALRTLCASFPSATTAVTSPLDALAPFFPYGTTDSLELHLIDVRTNFNAYFDSLAQDHPGYFFQSGTDRFAMPFAVFTTAGTLEGLQYGLPASHPAARRPELIRLRDSFDGCLDQIISRYHWTLPPALKPLPASDFARQSATWFGDHSSPVDDWVARFCSVNHSMSLMDQGSSFSEEPDPDEVYRRYCNWLAFVSRVDFFIAKASADLLYEPTYQPGRYPFQPPVSFFGWSIVGS